MEVKNALIVRLLIILTVFSSRLSRANEGFLNYPAYSTLGAIWSATVAITAGDKAAPIIFPGTILFKKIIGNDVVFGVLTAGHSLTKVGVSGVKDMSVSKNIHFVETLKEIEALPGEIPLASVVISSELDLGFFAIRAPKAYFAFSEPAQLSWACSANVGDYVGLIGYPGVRLRDSAVQTVTTLAPKLITKRMSEGVISSSNITGNTDDRESKTIRLNEHFWGTSADSLEGNSGGPAFNKEGAIIGVLVGSTVSSQAKFDGKDSVGADKTHSVITECASTKNFAFKAWERYQMTKP